MALLHLDGFTAYSAIADLDSRYVRVGGSANLRIDSDGGQLGNGALEVGGVDRSASGIEFTHGSLLQTYYMGFWLEYLGFDPTDDLEDVILTFQSTTSVRFSLALQQDGSLILQRGTVSTEFWDSADPAETADGEAHYLFADTQYKIEIYVDALNTTGSFSLWVNDELWAEFEGDIDLDGTTNRFAFHTGLEGSGAHYRIADWYLLDTTGDDNNARLGQGWRVEVRRPDADSATEDDFTASSGTDNFAMVDEASPADEDATYNESSTNGHIDRFTCSASLNQKKVHSVNVIARARHTGTAQDLRCVIFEGATSGNGSDQALSDSFEPYFEKFDTNPDTTLPWTVAELEAAEFGYEARA